MPNATRKMCNSIEDETELRRGPWTIEEDTLLIHYIACHGEGRWNMLAKCAGLKRTGKSCRLRWLNYLKPDIKRGNLTPQEQLLILELHSKWGNRWSKIAQNLPGRTDNEIKNYWRTRVQRQARQLNIESHSKRFLDAVRRFWMPRLLQKLEQTSSSSLTTMKSQNFTESSASPNSSVRSLPPASPPPSKQVLNRPNKNSSSSSVTTPSNFPSDSMTMSQLPEISEHLSSPAHAFGNHVYNPFLNDNYFGNSSSYDMEGFNLASMSAMGTSSPIESQMAQIEWDNVNMADTLWNMDDMWQ